MSVRRSLAVGGGIMVWRIIRQGVGTPDFSGTLRYRNQRGALRYVPRLGSY